MTVKQVAIKDVVDGGDVFRAVQDRERKTMLAHQRGDLFCVGGSVQIHREQLETLRYPCCLALIERDPVFFTALCVGDPKVQQHWLAAQRGQTSCLAAEFL